ncbi:putative oxidoreductase YtbE [bioreactor metagenome]|uniref:Putative oxidoreductase YtbE n=1 Tax=bioreactor metagenome TaxID=1076179 RepID=A0A644X962_9ZZZZ
MIFEETYTLSNGVQIPKLGLGTWFIEDAAAANAVRDAVQIGYRHFDTAQAYGNERGVGEGVRGCGVPRKELFVTTKLAAEIKTYQEAAAAIEGSLKIMGLDYIDLMLIHSPQPWQDYRNGDYAEGNLEAWRALEDAYKAGKLRAIGISNFEKKDIDNLLSGCSVAPMVNQLLVHVGNTPFELIGYSASKGMLVEAYSPIAHGEVLKNDTIVAIAKKYGASVPQLCIRYDLQLGTLPLPKTANPEHMRDNAKVDFVISDEDMARLKAMERIKDYGEFSFFPVFSGK